MSAPIPADLRELYDAASTVKEAMPGLWIPHAGPRVVELIERIAALEAQNRQLREALKRFISVATDAMPWSEHLDEAVERGRAALAPTEPKEKK